GNNSAVDAVHDEGVSYQGHITTAPSASSRGDNAGIAHRQVVCREHDVTTLPRARGIVTQGGPIGKPHGARFHQDGPAARTTGKDERTIMNPYGAKALRSVRRQPGGSVGRLDLHITRGSHTGKINTTTRSA